MGTFWSSFGQDLKKAGTSVLEESRELGVFGRGAKYGAGDYFSGGLEVAKGFGNTVYANSSIPNWTKFGRGAATVVAGNLAINGIKGMYRGVTGQD